MKKVSSIFELCASGFALAATMVLAKAMTLWSVKSTGVGSFGKLGVSRCLAWFAQDISFGLLFGVLISAASLVALRAAGARPKLSLLLRIVRDLCIALTCIGLAAALRVYWLFGMAPTFALASELGAAPGNANDSVLALVDAHFLFICFALVVTAFACRWLLRQFLAERWPDARVGMGVAGLFALSLTIALLVDRDSLDLDRNGVYSFLWTSATKYSPEGMDTAGIDGSELSLDQVLEPVLGGKGAQASPDLSGLQEWIAGLDRPPNIVLVILETTATKHMGVTGGPHNNTPNLSRYAQNAWMWNQHYTHLPLSMSSIYSIHCSSFGVPFGELITDTTPRINCGSLPETLVDDGYRAALFHSGRFSFGNKDRFLRDRGYSLLYDANTMPRRKEFQENSWGLEEQAAITALSEWASKQSGPFLATYIPVAPHHPYNVPRGHARVFSQRGSVGNYINAIHYVDEMVGTLVENFERTGLGQNTLFVFVGDHGEGFGEHAGNFMHGSKIYEEGVRSFVLWYAPRARLGARSDMRLTGHADILPTLLELLQRSPTGQYEGRSQVPAQPARMVPIFTNAAHRYLGFRDGDWKYHFNRSSGTHELFNLQDDPGETNNLAAEHHKEVLLYRQRARMLIAYEKYREEMLTQQLPPRDSKRSAVDEERWKTATQETWKVDLNADCERPAQFIELNEAQELRPIKVGNPTVHCRMEVPEGSVVRVNSLEILGRDKIGGAWVEGNLQFVSAQESTAIVGCQINQSENCRATVEQGAVLAGPGALELDLRFVMFHGLPKTNPHPDYFAAGAKVELQIAR